jgi:hypothetical protein
MLLPFRVGLRLRLAAAASAVSLSFLLGGCNTAPPADARADAAKPRVVTNEYKYVTPTGSNIPVRVRKNSTGLPETSSPVSTMTAEQLGEIQTRGNALKYPQ